MVSRGLDGVRQDALKFNKEDFGNIFRRKCNPEDRIKRIQRCLEAVDSAKLYFLENDLRHEYNRTLHREEMLWYQKSPEKWARFRDKNTTFFHTQTIVRRKRNRIEDLLLSDGS